METKAPAGYFGDWTDIDHPGTAGTPLGKRAYYIEITQDNDSSVLWLDNADYNADILTADKGGTKLVTGGGVETTVSIIVPPKILLALTAPTTAAKRPTRTAIPPPPRTA